MRHRPTAILAAALLMGCKAAPRAAPAASSTPSAIEPAAPAVSSAPTAPTPSVDANGAVYVLVAHSGVLRIANGKVEKVVALDESAASSVNLAVSPAGELWVSGWQGIRAWPPGGPVRSVRAVQDGPLYERLAVRSPTDAWAVTSDIEWSVVHHDGTKWEKVRSRAQFPGRYDDNKLEGFVVTSDAVWVSSWNGLWRGAGADWQRVRGPLADDGLLSLLVYRDRVIAFDHHGYFLREAQGWRQLRWPEGTTLRGAVSDLGIIAAPSLDGPTIKIGSIEGKGPPLVSPPVLRRDLSSVAIDGAGRIWIGSDYGLAVTDRTGRLLAQWGAGALDGLTGSVIQIVVTGGGPSALPAAKPARTWDVIGRIRIYKSSAPMANATLALCSSIGDRDCAKAPSARTATTGKDGSFTLTAVPEGELQLHVRPPPGMAECATPFTVTGHSVVPSRDCKEDPGRPGVCDLGTLTDCLPFEMPPHRP